MGTGVSQPKSEFFEGKKYFKKNKKMLEGKGLFR
jgi:hypothetical protein